MMNIMTLRRVAWRERSGRGTERRGRNTHAFGEEHAEQVDEEAGWGVRGRRSRVSQ